MSSVTSLTDSLPMGLLSSNAISGATDQDKLKSCCKALEGLFTSEMLKEIGQNRDRREGSGEQPVRRLHPAGALAAGHLRRRPSASPSCSRNRSPRR